MASPKRLPVGVLGGTGAVGQRFVQLLKNHPQFQVVAIGASERSSGRPYADAVNWKLSEPICPVVASIHVVPCEPKHFSHCKLVFSGLDASVAGTVESEFANAGIPVFSNARNHRQHPKVPILIPIINAEHIDIVKHQDSFQKNGKGFIVTNANCSSTGLSIALKPILESFGISHMIVTTLQAISGAGYPGTPSLDIIDNVVPYISGEEEKVESEPKKILGKYECLSTDRVIEPASMHISAMCHRVAVTDGHTLSVALKVVEPSENLVEDVKNALRTFKPPAIVTSLHSCPEVAVEVREESDRPQPRLDRMAGEGMTTVVGRVRKCSIWDLRLTVVCHNTIIGAAGGSILNAELAVARDLIS